jgi:ribosome-binding factor A
VNNRILRVNELLQKEIGQILLREFNIGEGSLLTITRVEAFPNLQGAKVYISIMPENKREEVSRTLQRNIFEIQQLLNKRLKMRPVPKIQWVEDRAGGNAQRIGELLDQVKQEERPWPGDEVG